jgi:hypothetical protein
MVTTRSMYKSSSKLILFCYTIRYNFCLTFSTIDSESDEIAKKYMIEFNKVLSSVPKKGICKFFKIWKKF